jgi:hypothetical protein
MAFEGTTECELNWDFQGSSPILQSTSVGASPEMASHEEKEQVNLLIYSLRQGRFNLNVSSVGGLTITQAATTRENKEGKKYRLCVNLIVGILLNIFFTRTLRLEIF